MSKINFSADNVQITFADFTKVENFICSDSELEMLLLLRDNKPPSLLMDRFDLTESDFKIFLGKFHNKGILKVFLTENSSDKSEHQDDMLWRGSAYSSEKEEKKSPKASKPKPVKNLENRGFFEFLGLKLSEAIGPIADVVLEDILVDMDENRETFHLERAQELIDLLVGEIPRDDKKGEFHEVMMAKLRS